MEATTRFHSAESTTGAYTAIQLAANNGNSALGWWNIGTVSTSTNYDNHLVFQTRTGASTYAERMRIDSSGVIKLITANDTAGTSKFLTFGTNSFNRAGIKCTNAATYDGSLEFYTGNSTNFLERMRIDSSGNVGIGTSSPSKPVHVVSTNSGATTTPLLLQNNQGAADGAVEIRLAPTGYPNDIGSTARWVGIRATNTGTGNGTKLSFLTNTTSADPEERMRIDDNGNLLVGTTSTTVGAGGSGVKGFRVDGATGIVQAAASSSTSAIFNRTTDDGDIADFRKDGTTVGSIGSNGSNLQVNGIGALELQENGATRAYVESTGLHPWADNTYDLGTSSARWKDLYLSGGAYLGGTGSANHLDDYEEGTWSPTISTGTASFSNATYTKVGRVVVVTVFFTSVSDQSSATALQVGNLPFTSDSNTFSSATGLSRHFNRGDGTIVTYLGGNNNVINFYALDLGADYLSVRHSDLNNAGANYYVTMTYMAA
jgi:hypothetical protein